MIFMTLIKIKSKENLLVGVDFFKNNEEARNNPKFSHKGDTQARDQVYRYRPSHSKYTNNNRLKKYYICNKLFDNTLHWWKETRIFPISILCSYTRKIRNGSVFVKVGTLWACSGSAPFPGSSWPPCYSGHITLINEFIAYLSVISELLYIIQ